MANLTVSFKGTSTPISDIQLDTTTLAELQTRLYEATNVLPEAQKLLWKGKKASAGKDATLAEAGLKSGTKIMLLGTTSEELTSFKKEESEANRKAAILARRVASGPSKIRSTAKPNPEADQYKFMRIEPLPHLPKPEEARKILTKLANDPAIRHIMIDHKFAVGLLTELAPHEQPHLLGLNENSGQAIKLRIRTDAYDGFRLYAEIRRVALHELTHNVWGPHDDNFKQLNSQLNREVASFEAAQKEGAHTLGGASYGGSSGDDGEEVSWVGGMVGGSHVLGGGGGSSSSSLLISAEERRARAVEAAMRRFEEQEAEIEDRCAS